jgi:hypothetical protein
MLFKSDVPMSHRGAFVVASMVTIAPILQMMRGAGLEALRLYPGGGNRLGLVVYQWRQRSTSEWQIRNAEGYGHNTPADWVQSGIDRAPDWLYVALVMLAAIALFWAFSRG